MASTPRANARPQIYLKFSISGDDLPHEGIVFERFEYKAMVNGGYIIRANLFDPYSNLLGKLVKNGYFEVSRQTPIVVTFQIKWDAKGRYPDSATRPNQQAFVVSLQARGGSPDVAHLEFVAIDPPSWYLNTGDASGKAYRGRVSDVIREVVEQYAPNIDLDVTRTTDSPNNRWYMMRQDPKTFISSLLDWSSSITPQQTHWMIVPYGSGNKIVIKEQADFQSQARAYYRYHHDDNHDTIKDWEILADNALSVSATKLVTAGLSATSGQYLDRITDTAERKVFAKDATTSSKIIANVDRSESFERVPDGKPPDTEVSGWTAISAIPELYSAGDLGKRYEEYVDGRPRGMYLKLLNRLFRARFQVVGHGIWSDCRGLGVDTFFVKWDAADGSDYFLNGNWLAYGFEHVVTRRSWVTNVYGARFDHDAIAYRVGGGT